MTQKYQVKVSMKQAAIVETGIVLKQGDFGIQIEIEVLDFDATGTTPQIVFRKAQGAVESTTITVSGNKYTYTFVGTELDTPGKCFCDLKLKNSTTQRISTASFAFKVIADTLDGLNEHANSYSDTIGQIWQTLQDYSDDSEAWAKGTKGGTPVASTDVQYHNNAKYYSDIAGGHSDDAENSAEDSEAWAVGTKNGTAVDSSAPQYHNNAKYWSDQTSGSSDKVLSSKAVDPSYTDLNQFMIMGVYTFPTTSEYEHDPIGTGTRRILMVLLNLTSNLPSAQIIFNRDNGNAYFRSYINAGWGSWGSLANTEINALKDSVIDVRGLIPYSGGLSDIAADESVDKSLYYYNSLTTHAGYKRVMYYDSALNKWSYLPDNADIDDVNTFMPILENTYSRIINDIFLGNLAFPTAYNGSVVTLAADQTANKDLIYYNSKSSASTYERLMFYNKQYNDWQYLGTHKISEINMYYVQFFETIGAIPYRLGGLPVINNDASVDTSKVYYVDKTSADSYRQVMKYDNNESAWVYDHTFIQYYSLTSAVIPQLLGYIPFVGNLSTLERADSDKGKTYICVKAGTNFGKLAYYDYANSQWAYGDSFLSMFEKWSDLIGAVPYYRGNLSSINGDNSVDTTKIYYVASRTSSSYLRKMAYDSTASEWKYTDRTIITFPDIVVLISKVLGAIPYYGNLAEFTNDPKVNTNTSNRYFVAQSSSGKYLTLIVYNQESSAWEYASIIPNLCDVSDDYQDYKSINIENPKVHAYLKETKYDNSDYSYNNVLKYAADDYDYPVGALVKWNYSETCDSFNVKITLSGDFENSYTYNVSNTTKTFEVKNLDPSKIAGVKVSAVNSGTETVILSKAIACTGQERMITVGGIRNVRDIGGWKCTNGKIAYGKIFRGSAIDESGSTITDAGKIVLYNQLNVRSEIDLRNTAEPSQSIIGTDCIRYQVKGYSYITGFEDTAAAYAVLSRVFNEVANGNVIYMHCSGGCDRTAFYTCMIEGILGVSEEDLTKDFELSSFMNKSYSENYRRYRNMGTTYAHRNWAGLIALIKGLTGDTWQEKFYNYFIGIGFTAEEITAFKNAMISK